MTLRDYKTKLGRAGEVIWTFPDAQECQEEDRSKAPVVEVEVRLMGVM